MFSIDTQKAANKVAFSHDSAPLLLLNYLRDLEKTEVLKNIMSALRHADSRQAAKFKGTSSRGGIWILRDWQRNENLSHIALSYKGFVFFKARSGSELYGNIDILNADNIGSVDDLTVAKTSLHSNIDRYCLEFDTALRAWQIEKDIDASLLHSSENFCCFPFLSKKKYK